MLGDGVTQRLLLGMIERRLQHDAPRTLDRLENLVIRHLLDFNEQSGASGLQAGREMLHEIIVDPVICERTTKRPRGGADGGPQERHQEDHSDQRAPKAAG